VKKSLALVVAAVVVVAALGAVAFFVLRGDGESRATGVCGPATSWELSAEDEDGSTEVAFEMLSAGPDERWTVEVVQGDDVLLEGERATDEDAELDLDVVARDGGSSTFTVTATPAEGDACVATLER